MSLETNHCHTHFFVCHPSVQEWECWKEDSTLLYELKDWNGEQLCYFLKSYKNYGQPLAYGPTWPGRVLILSVRICPVFCRCKAGKCCCFFHFKTSPNPTHAVYQRCWVLPEIEGARHAIWEEAVRPAVAVGWPGETWPLNTGEAQPRPHKLGGAEVSSASWSWCLCCVLLSISLIKLSLRWQDLSNAWNIWRTMVK